MIRCSPWLLLFFFSFCSSEFIVVNTTRGLVKGFDHDMGRNTSQIFYGYGQVFLGIPFALPPLGERRFSLPQPLCAYNDRGDVHDATYYRPRCPQKPNKFESSSNNGYSEDCLHLNVMTPNVSGSYPVMVYIHGGTFTTGGADIYHWKGAIRNLVSRGVVVVTIQYRLGMLGFFTTFTEQFPPNRGLFDQILALRWVQEEITSFGGDPNKVTIFGQSAGAASVSDLSLSPFARGLFHHVIQSSGSALLEIETIEDPRGSKSQNRAHEICRVDSSDWGSPTKDQELMDCLLNASIEDLTEHDMGDGKGWNAMIDGALLPDVPANLATNRPKYPTLIGDMMEDYAIFIIPYLSFKISKKNAVDVLRDTWPNYDEETLDRLATTMIDRYANGTLPSEYDSLGWMKLLTNIFTGNFFDAHSHRDVEWHQKAGNEDVWLFTFAHHSKLPFKMEINGWIPISHSSDLPYLWFYPHIWETYEASASDFAVAENIGKMWTDFAKFGSLPHPRVGNTKRYVEICENSTSRMNWKREAEEVYNQQFPTYVGEYPPLPMSNISRQKLKELGEKVLAKWNSMQCSTIDGQMRSLDSAAAKSGPRTSLKALTMLMLAQSLQLMRQIFNR